MKRNVSILAFAIVSMAIVSCDKNGDAAVDQENSQIELNVEICSDNAVALSVVPELQSEYIVGVFDSEFYSSNADDISSLLREGQGQAKKSTGERAIVFTGLDSSKEYYVCAVYGDEKYLAVSVPFTTKDGMTDIISLPVDLIDYAELYMDGLHNFRFRMTDAEFSDSGEGFGGFWDEGTLLEVNAVKEWKGIEHLPEPYEFSGIYSSDPSLSGKPGSVMMNNTSMRLIEDRSVVLEYEVDSVKMCVQVNGEEIEALAVVTLSDGSEYSFTYEGNFNFTETGYYGRYGYSPLLAEDLTGLDYPLMKETYYCGEVDGLSHYTMACVNNPDPDSPFGGYNKHCLRINILAPHQESPLDCIPEGTYEISAETGGYLAQEGDYKRVDMTNIEYVGTYYYNLDEESFEQTMGFLTSGTVTVSKDGDTYTVEVDAETHDGHKVSGKYQGPLTVVEEPEWW